MSAPAIRPYALLLLMGFVTTMTGWYPLPALASDIPDSPAGRLLDRYLSLCTPKKRMDLKEWLQGALAPEAGKSPPVARVIDEELKFCDSHGGFHLVEWNSPEPLSIAALFWGLKSGLWFRIELSAKEQDRIGRLVVVPAVAPEASMPEQLDRTVMSAKLEKTLEILHGLDLFSGVVAMAKGAEIILLKSSGYADEATRRPFDERTQFTIGSMGKMFTAVAIGQLIEKKRLSLEDSVGSIFPDYPNPIIRDKATIGMLLSHRAGLGDFLARRPPKMMAEGVARAEEFLPLFSSDAPLFEPGSSGSYSNAGFALAGAIVEKLSGEDYPDYLRHQIFEPLGMTGSDPNNRPVSAPDLATPYTKFSLSGSASDWHVAERDLGSPAGGAISTAADLLRFADGLKRGLILSVPVRDALTRKITPLPGGRGYGYGFEIDACYGMDYFGHGGGFPGVSTHLDMMRGPNFALVVLSNRDPPSGKDAELSALALMTEFAKRGNQGPH